MGTRFESVPAIKMTDTTRLYRKSGMTVSVSFKNQKICRIDFINAGGRPFTDAQLWTLLESEAPRTSWDIVSEDRTEYGTMRFYKTKDGKLVGSSSGEYLSINTPEVDY
jgi:hypothetical protein